MLGSNQRDDRASNENISMQIQTANRCSRWTLSARLLTLLQSPTWSESGCWHDVLVITCLALSRKDNLHRIHKMKSDTGLSGRELNSLGGEHERAFPVGPAIKKPANVGVFLLRKALFLNGGAGTSWTEVAFLERVTCHNDSFSLLAKSLGIQKIGRPSNREIQQAGRLAALD